MPEFIPFTNRNALVEELIPIKNAGVVQLRIFPKIVSSFSVRVAMVSGNFPALPAEQLLGDARLSKRLHPQRVDDILVEQTEQLF